MCIRDRPSPKTDRPGVSGGRHCFGADTAGGLRGPADSRSCPESYLTDDGRNAVSASIRVDRTAAAANDAVDWME
eukprot:1122703-Pyramimonas_sp.AAC.1